MWLPFPTDCKASFPLPAPKKSVSFFVVFAALHGYRELDAYLDGPAAPCTAARWRAGRCI
jgi:hypothetical protein